MTEKETQDLLTKYKSPLGPGLVNYRDFVNSLNKVFLDEANPSAAIAAARSNAVSYKTGDFNLNLNRATLMRRNKR